MRTAVATNIDALAHRPRERILGRVSSQVFDPTGASDGEIARAVGAGAGTRAEAALVDRFERRVFLYGMRHLGDEASARDLAQEVLAITLEKLRAGEVREPDRIGSFVLGTARFVARQVRRRARREAEVVTRAADEQPATTELREPVDLERLAVALAELPERERAVVLLTFEHDRSAQEIGEVFGLRPGHVRVLRHRAIARLAARFGALDPREEDR